MERKKDFNTEHERELTNKRLFNLKAIEYETKMDLAVYQANQDDKGAEATILKLESLCRSIGAIEKMLKEREE